MNIDAVIPAPKVYTKAVAVKTLVVELQHPTIFPRSLCSMVCGLSFLFSFLNGRALFQRGACLVWVGSLKGLFRLLNGAATPKRSIGRGRFFSVFSWFNPSADSDFSSLLVEVGEDSNL